MTGNLQPGTFRSRTNLLGAIASELLRPALRLQARILCNKPATPPPAWRRGLLVGLDHHIGDLLYNTASLPQLARGLPDCRWYFAALRGPAEVLANNPNLAGVVAADHSADFFSRDSAFGRRIAELRFDVAVNYNSGNPSSVLRFMLLHRIPNRASRVHKGFSGWITHPIGFHPYQPYPAYFRDLVSELTGAKPDWTLRPQVFPDAQDEIAAETYLRALAPQPDAPLVACFLTSRQPRGVWPPEAFARALREVAARRRIRPILCGAKSDAEVLARINRDFSLDAEINAGELGLRALTCFLRRCAVVLCPDSGPRHLANAAGVPVVFVRNLWPRKIETGAYCDTEYDMAPDAECVPPEEQDAQLARTTPEQVAARVLACLP